MLPTLPPICCVAQTSFDPPDPLKCRDYRCVLLCPETFVVVPDRMHEEPGVGSGEGLISRLLGCSAGGCGGWGKKRRESLWDYVRIKVLFYTQHLDTWDCGLLIPKVRVHI